MSPLWDGLQGAQDIVDAGKTSQMASLMRIMADKLDEEADFMEFAHSQIELQALGCERLQKLCAAQQERIWRGAPFDAHSSLGDSRNQGNLAARSATIITETANGAAHQLLAGCQPSQQAQPAPLQLPEADYHAVSWDGPSPISSSESTAYASSPQGEDIDPQVMLCNPLYSMGSLKFRGVPSAPDSESSVPEASSAAPAAPLRPAVSLCSSPAGNCSAQQQPRNTRLPQLTAQRTWPPRLALPGNEAEASCSEAVMQERQAMAPGRHLEVPSEGDSSACFGAADARIIVSCVSSPRAAAVPQPEQASLDAQPHGAAAVLSRSIVASLQRSKEGAQAAQGEKPHGGSDVAASMALNAASEARQAQGQGRTMRPWRPRPLPPPSSCASNRPLKSSGPFFPPAARFVPSPSARCAARSAFAEAEIGSQPCNSQDGAAASRVPWESVRAEAETSRGVEDRGDHEAHRSRVDNCSTPGTMIVKGDKEEMPLAWGGRFQGRQPEADLLPKLQKENSASPEQRPPDSTKFGRSGAAEALQILQPDQPGGPPSPLRERNSPDAAARYTEPLVARPLAAPGSPAARPGSCQLPSPGPLAAYSPALVSATNRRLRSRPAQAAPLQSAPRADGAADAEVSLASPLRRSMQSASGKMAGRSSRLPPEASYQASRTSGERSQRGRHEWGRGQGNEPQTLAMLRSSGILHRDGPLAASGAAALARASAPQQSVSLRRPHPADLEAAERLRASLSSEGGSSHASSARQQQGKEECALRASGGMQAPSTPKHAPRPNTLPDSPLTSTRSVAHEQGFPGQALARHTPARPAAAGTMQPHAPPTVPKHLATPSLMLRAGDAAVYDEPEVDRVTPRGDPPPRAVADLVPEKSARSVTIEASPVPTKPEALPAGAAKGPTAAALHPIPQLPLHLRGAFSPMRAPAAGKQASVPAPGPRPSTNPSPAIVPGDTILRQQDDTPDRLGISAAALVAAAARLKRVSGVTAAPPPPLPPPAPKVAQRAGTPANAAPEAASGNAREAMLSAIKNGNFKLRKTVIQPKGELGEAGTGAEGARFDGGCTPAMAALMERARAMRAAAYPPSTVNGSDASSWDT